MAIIQLELNKIVPFVDDINVHQFEYLNTQKKITSGTLEIKSKLDLDILYNVSIRISPAINEITQAKSLSLCDEKFNMYIDKFKPDEKLQKKFQFIFNDEKNDDLLNSLFQQNIEKKSSIRNILNTSLRGLKEDLAIKNYQDEFSKYFNDNLKYIVSETVYNDDLNIFEKSTALEILYDISPIETLYNIWMSFINDTEYFDYSIINYYMLRIQYPYITDPYLFDYSTGFLDPFDLRNNIQLKIINENIITGLKCDIQYFNLNISNNGYSSYLNENSIFDFITLNANVENLSNLLEEELLEIQDNGYFKPIKRNKIQSIDSFPLYQQSKINLNYINKNNNKITEFTDFMTKADEITEFVNQKTLTFWDNELINNTIFQIPVSVENEYPDLLLDMKNNIINAKQYTDISDNSINSIIYKGLKE